MKRRAAVLLFAVAAAFALCLPPALAGGGRHAGHRGGLVVDNQPRDHWSCLGTWNPFDTIQGAVDVAPAGATIWVCPGLYTETVRVGEGKDGLTLLGANAHRDPTGPRGAESIVQHRDLDGTVQLAADNITWDGFTILGIPTRQNGPGMVTSPAHSGYLIRDTIFQDNGVGLDLAASGERPSFVCRNLFVKNNEFDPTGGYGIFSDRPTRQVLITSNRFEGHNGGAILLADTGRVDTHTDVLIDHNTSVDDLTFATIYSSSRVRLSSNDARDRLAGPPGGASAIYIGARTQDIAVHHNRVHSASGNGIDVTPSGKKGSDPAPPLRVAVTRNKVDHAKLAGLHMADGTEHVTVTGNTALANGKVDCWDESHNGNGTAGTRNTWTENLGRTDDPNGICAQPTTPEPEPGHAGHHHHKKKHKQQQPDPCSCRRYPKAF